MKQYAYSHTRKRQLYYKTRAKIIADAKAQENMMLAKARKEASQMLMTCHKQVMQDEVSALNALKYQEYNKIDELKEHMIQQTNQFQHALNDNVTSTIQGLKNLKYEMYDQIDDWQRDLYALQYYPIANSYVELYKILMIDKLFDHDNHNLIEHVCKLQKTMRIYMKRFEAALHTLGLRVYYPQSDELYDERYHCLHQEVIMKEDSVYKICECIVPGIEKIVNEDDNDIIIPAIVDIYKCDE